MSTTITNSTAERKHSHVDICLRGDVAFSTITTGLERYRLRHNALPELNYDNLSTETDFLGKRIGAPLMISSMTGGYSEAAELNGKLAEAAERFQLPLGVGSMRQALEESSHRDSFAVVRRHAPTTQIFANIGAPEIAKGLSSDDLQTMIEMIRADGLIIHLNAAQELFQPEGGTDFRRVLDEVAAITAKLSVPVIAKEVGCGISAPVARQLLNAGVRVIDVAGAGGISWQKVEEARYTRRFGTDDRFSTRGLEELLNWGTPTAECLVAVNALRENPTPPFSLIASGGIQSGIDIAKSIALGADLAASAGALLRSLHSGTLEETLTTWMNDLRAAMFLTGSATIAELQNNRPISKQ
ncbi:type 2 isopentenyl-diphosphate Delta-isomerase [Chlorobium phaeovibrioides]|uniref:Isopentenyl-diphosphate delta-isomerase n=2 Tax=Chlorobium phaeovibrioides TaxID=1094 RepID=IDI2_CHLPM|nr:type 2 isopentenyl-diphosphate Delta-isomerase [Chlorobium phaeovibrioides]A4SGE6.1 RecName: Full=Isopentenyl-diphosphate delta-isomerase; Short=IPP isomerase; AltName: Full=Isopentenyl diphosphate:dimethylallyl diphosphate isomerase; AltName: Full=Isopentenyl pyrophosphate isomerase; AltName: Full=Type 2 isopentenyl diphosphate isomerase; Short=IDI-2 [Chlorobium phaeovibrioides DSM 265]HCD35946.1 type 2 isopentenyl-diphosphate Delta-isomerase [Chlorobium sp.]KAA6230632.1 type 2 isopentenyl-d